MVEEVIEEKVVEREIIVEMFEKRENEGRERERERNKKKKKQCSTDSEMVAENVASEPSHPTEEPFHLNKRCTSLPKTLRLPLVRKKTLVEKSQKLIPPIHTPNMEPLVTVARMLTQPPREGNLTLECPFISPNYGKAQEKEEKKEEEGQGRGGEKEKEVIQEDKRESEGGIEKIEDGPSYHTKKLVSLDPSQQKQDDETSSLHDKHVQDERRALLDSEITKSNKREEEDEHHSPIGFDSP